MIPKYFSEESLRKIARAIALHTDSLTQAVLRPEQDYFAALLIIADEVQEWGRPRSGGDPPVTEQIELNNLKVGFKKVPKIVSFFDRILNGSGKHKLPKLKLGMKRQFENSLIVEENGDDFRIILQIKVKSSEELSKEIQKMPRKEKKRLVLEDARNVANTLIGNLSIFADSIGLEAVEIEPDKIISSKDAKSVSLEIPMLRKSNLFPINADRNLLSIILAVVLATLSPYRAENVPKITFEDNEDQTIEFNIPHLRKSEISSKRRNLHRLNTFRWDWGIRIISHPTCDGEKEHLFPIKNIEDL